MVGDIDGVVLALMPVIVGAGTDVVMVVTVDR